MNREKFFSLLGGMSFAHLSEVQTAYWLAKNAHRLQKPRDDGRRYFEHPREVAIILIERGFGTKDHIIRALLHDVVEDTNTPTQVVVELFGHDVWKSLAVLSKYIPLFDPVTGQTIGKYKKESAVYYEELAKSPEEDRRVKLADRYSNMRSMEAWDAERRYRYAVETRDYLLPIAENTDPWFARELENLVNQSIFLDKK